MASWGFAIEELKRGGAVTRVCWPPQLNMMVQMHVPAPGQSAMTMPYFYMSTGEGKGQNRYPWMPSMDEQLAEDWNPLKKSKLIIPMSRGGVGAAN